MKISLSNKSRTFLIRSAINLLILSIIAIGLLINPSQHSFAEHTLAEQSLTEQTFDHQKLVKQAFEDFCFIYYHDGKDKEENQDTQVCQKQSSAFASLLLDESPNGSKQWIVQDSLHDLALQNLLSTKDKKPIRSQQDFADSITNADLKALISGSGNDQKKIPQDKNFLPTLWDFKSTSTSSASSAPSKPDETPSDPSPSSQSAPSLIKINVNCHYTTTLVCTILTGGGGTN